jgi:hypothetical protein
LLAGAGGGKDNKVIVVVDDGSKDDNDGDKEDNDNEEDNNDDNDVSLSSVSFLKMKFHTNGSAILQNNLCFCSESIQTWGGHN